MQLIIEVFDQKETRGCIPGELVVGFGRRQFPHTELRRTNDALDRIKHEIFPELGIEVGILRRHLHQGLLVIKPIGVLQAQRIEDKMEELMADFIQIRSWRGTNDQIVILTVIARQSR